MDGAGGGLGHDVTVPGSHMIIGNLKYYSSHDMTPTVSKDVRIVTVGHWFLVVNNLAINVLFPHNVLSSPKERDVILR